MDARGELPWASSSPPGVEGNPGLLQKGAVLDRPVALLSFLGKEDATGLLYLDLTGLYTLSAGGSMSVEKTSAGGVVREGGD